MDISNENNKVEKSQRGGNRKGFRWDKDSEEYKRYFERHKISRNRTTRQKLEALAKAPLLNRFYKPNYERRTKRTKITDS